MRLPQLPDSVLMLTYVPALSVYALAGAYTCAALALFDVARAKPQDVTYATSCDLGNHTYCVEPCTCDCHDQEDQ